MGDATCWALQSGRQTAQSAVRTSDDGRLASVCRSRLGARRQAGDGPGPVRPGVYFGSTSEWPACGNDDDGDVECRLWAIRRESGHDSRTRWLWPLSRVSLGL